MLEATGPMCLGAGKKKEGLWGQATRPRPAHRATLWTPCSDEFIEEYRRPRATQPDVVEALIRKGMAFHSGHGWGQPPN